MWLLREAELSLLQWFQWCCRVWQHLEVVSHFWNGYLWHGSDKVFFRLTLSYRRNCSLNIYLSEEDLSGSGFEGSLAVCRRTLCHCRGVQFISFLCSLTVAAVERAAVRYSLLCFGKICCCIWINCATSLIHTVLTENVNRHKQNSWYTFYKKVQQVNCLSF